MSFDYKKLTKFEVNIGDKETKIRLIAGSALLTASLFMASIVLLFLGLVLVATGYTRVCPAYSAMDKNTLESGTEAAAEE